jgi:uncharacterized membrane protein/uncharacterized RDD family membrane protein YckC
MSWDPLVQFSGVGVVFLLNLVGVLALVLPGRLDAAARLVGLGRHVEALIILSIASTIYFAGIGNVPVWIDENGVVAFSLIGAVLPTVLSIHFLARAGLLRGAVAVVGVAATSIVAYLVSRPVEDMGIISEYPYFLLPSLTAAVAGTLAAPFRLGAIPIAYACGSLGALIGGDLVRFQWVLETRKAVAGSFGGAEVFDLVFLAGLWGAAFAAVPLVGYWAALRRRDEPWETTARLLSQGRSHEALTYATRLVAEHLRAWAAARGLQAESGLVVRRASDAEPVFAQVEQAVRLGPALTPEVARPILERLEALHRRLRKPAPPLPAPPARRVAAALIDLLVPLLLTVAALAVAPRAPAAPTAFFALSTFLSMHILYPLLAEWATNGRTLGKGLMGLRVVRLDGRRLRGWDATVRNLGRLLDLPLFYLIAFAAPEENGRQRMGDYFAEVVVADAKASQRSTPVTTSATPMPTPAAQGTGPTAREPR